MFNNKGQVSAIKGIAIAVGVIFAFYLVMTALANFNNITGTPVFPTIKAIKATMDFFILLILFVLIQALFVYGYYQAFRFTKKLYLLYKNKILKWGLNMKHRALMSR